MLMLLLLLVGAAVAGVLPKRLGVEMEVDEVVGLVGLLAMKENAGFGAAVESAALCPKVKEGLGASVVDVSLLSAGLPKVNTGAAGSVAALALPKAKPPEELLSAGALSASLAAPPKTKAGGAEEAAGSFFTSGFPKVKVGAAGSLSTCMDPNVEPVCGVGSPSLLKTDLVVVVVVELVFNDAVLFDDAVLSGFS